MTPETLAYLSEATEPTGVPYLEAQQTALQFLDMTDRLDQQIATWRRRLQAAEFTEGDPAVRAYFEEHMQTLGALQRELRETEAALRNGANALRQYADLGQKMAAALAPPPEQEPEGEPEP